MADYVEQAMQEMVPELDDLRRKRIFDDDEIRQIVRRRRDFEYLLQRIPGKPQDYLSYVRYEVALEALRDRKAKKLGWRRRKSVSDFAGVRRVHKILERATSRWKGDVRLWYQHIDFCLRSGSTTILNSVLLRALKYHPKHINLWLLAADRELQLGHIAAARKLLFRGIRFSPKSAKLYGELLRLEAGVATELLSANTAGDGDGIAKEVAVKDDEEADAKQTADVWAPSRLLVRKAMTKLSSVPAECAKFLRIASSLLSDAVKKWPGSEGLDELKSVVRQASADHRPGKLQVHGLEIASVSKAWTEVLDDVAADLWQLWWTQEHSFGELWLALTKAVIDSSNSPAVRRLAEVLGQESRQESSDAIEASIVLAETDTAAIDAASAMFLLEALGKSPASKSQTAYRSLLRRAADANPGHPRLVLMAAREGANGLTASAAANLLQRASHLRSSDAVQLMYLVLPKDSTPSSSSIEATKIQAQKAHTLERMMRALEPGESVGPLIMLFLSNAMASGGDSEFRRSCQEARKVAGNLWDMPALRAALLCSVLDAELRLGVTTSEVKRLATCFEEILACLGDGKSHEAVEWWLKYAEFSQQVSCWDGAAGVPKPTDIHYRAMKSVPDQAKYQELAQRLLNRLTA